MKRASGFGERPGSGASVTVVLLLYVLTGLIFYVVATTRNGLFPTGDLLVWRADFGSLAHCLAGHSQSCAEISKFPLGYTFNSALLALAAKLTPLPFPDFVGILNSFALALPILLLRSTQGSRALLTAWALYVAVWILTPIPRFYLFTGSLEVQAGALIGMAFVLTFGAIQAKPKPTNGKLRPTIGSLLVCNGLWFLACLYKDTSVLTVAVVGLLLLLPKPSLGQWRRAGRHPHAARQAEAASATRLLPGQPLGLLWLSLPGLVGASLCSIGLNLVRYHTILPEAYLHEAKITATPVLFRLQSLLWSLYSPNGGILVFWGLAIAALLLGTIWLGVGPSRLAIKAACLWASISLIGLSQWWNPFGWASWGNRLIVPAMMVVVICLWHGLTGPWDDQIRPALGRPSTGAIPTQPNKHQKESPLPTFYLQRLAIVVLLIIISAPYVALGYQANPSQAVNTPAPKAPHCTTMMTLLSGIPLEKHLELVYSSELYRQCALERFLHNPSAHS